MLDMVFNHTSDRNQWFQKALEGDEEYKRFYIFRKGKAPGVPPTNWQSKFGGAPGSMWKNLTNTICICSTFLSRI